MVTASEQLDRRFADLQPFASAAVRPPRGWIRAIRDGLGLTAGQLARRMGVKQPRITELEKGEASGRITIQSLERAAEAMGCRLVYALVPMRPLSDTIDQRAVSLASQQLASIEQTMRLENQGVSDKARHHEALARLVSELKRKPARLWDGP
ncbi:MAG TPA: mobile mystery protein A [Phenylobacterium sp.]|jgi:predicted DNA-binding mobile mystery protein A